MSTTSISAILLVMSLTTIAGIIQNPPCSTNDPIVFASVLFRHGARTPMRIYPTDPNRNTPGWRIGLEQLTNEGKNQALELGEFLRERYGKLLPETYNRDNITVYSTDVDRTLQSAQCVLTGMYPPKHEDMWNQRFPTWQPIPIHTRRAQDCPLQGGQFCPAYTVEFNKLMQTDEFVTYANNYKPLADFLSTKLHSPIKELVDWEYVYDQYRIECETNLTWPVWLTSDMFREMHNLALLSIQSEAYTPTLKRLQMGQFLHEILDHFRNKAERILTQNVWLYSGHDTNIINLLQTLKVFEPEMPTYSSAVLMELRERNSQHFVSFYYRNSTTHEPYVLKMPDCDVFCELGQFDELIRGVAMSPDEFVKECR